MCLVVYCNISGSSILCCNKTIYDPLKSTIDVDWHCMEVDDFALVLEVYAARTLAKHSTKFHSFKTQEEDEYQY